MYIELLTKRLRLRPLCMKDLLALYEYSGDKENIRYMLFLPHENLEEAEEFLEAAVDEWAKEQPSYFEFGMEYEGKLIGTMSAYQEDEGREVEFGWVIHKDYRGMGFAVEAALAVKRFALEQLRPERLTAHCDKRNHVSAKVMEKIGLCFVGEGVREYRTGERAAELAYVEKCQKKNRPVKKKYLTPTHFCSMISKVFRTNTLFSCRSTKRKWMIPWKKYLNKGCYMISTASCSPLTRGASMRMQCSMICLWERLQKSGESAGRVCMI